MAKKFLSFLGTGEYSECIYKCPNGSSVKTRFIQSALVEDLCREWTEEDEVIIFLTNASRNKNWEDSERLVEVSREEISPEETIIRRSKKYFTGLRKELESLNNKFKIIDKTIPEGKNVNEIWEIFNVMMESINEGDEVIFDITHSFRSIPMLALVVLNYAKVIKNINILGIYYGAFEAKDKDGVAPVFDLKEFDRLLEWSYAINSFVKFGDSRQILNFVEREKKYDEKYRGDVGKFAERLNDFTSTILTCRGMILDDRRKSVKRAYKEMKEQLNKIREENTLPQLKELLKLIKKGTEKFEYDDSLNIGLAFIDWCIKNNLVQQGYTALDETIKTYMCIINNLDEKDFYNREKVVGKACVLFAKKEEEWEVNDNSLREKIKEVISKTPKELLDLSQTIRDYRNDINHFGYREDAKNHDALSRKLREFYGEFVNIINNSYGG